MEQNILNNIKNVRTSQKSLPELVAEQIRGLIIEQHLEIGAKIPGEYELAEQLNVGRSSVREAVKILVARNILEIRRGKGTYVAHNTGIVDDPFGLAYMEDEERLAKELYEIRMHIEPWVASMAAESASQKNIEELKYWEEKSKELFLSGKNYLPADQQFHLAIANCTQNRVISILIPAITYSIHLFGKMNRKVMRLEAVNTHHQIVKAIEEKDSEAAYRAMVAHLTLNKEGVPGLSE